MTRSAFAFRDERGLRASIGRYGPAVGAAQLSVEPRPQAPATLRTTPPVDLVDVAVLEAEIAQMERVLAIANRHAELRAEMEARNIALLAYGVTMGDITTLIAAKHGLRLADLTGPARSKPFARARQEAMFTMYERRRADGVTRCWSTTQIGKFLGGRDHTTVIHGIRRHVQSIAQGGK